MRNSCPGTILIALSVLMIPLVVTTVHGQELFVPGQVNWIGHSTDTPADRAPAILGDAFVSSNQIVLEADGNVAAADVPIPGGSERLLVASNNSPLTRDRIYMTYSHVPGAVTSASTLPAAMGTGMSSLDQFVIGAEKTLMDGRASVEFRLPVATEQRVTYDTFTLGSDSHLGDVGVIGKFIIARSNVAAVSAGISVQLPTGDDVGGMYNGTTFLIERDGIYVSPFLAILAAPNDDWFYQVFTQADFAVQGDGFSTSGTPLQGQVSRGELEGQTLLRTSLGVGRWLHRSETGLLTAVAGMMELHYTRTLNDADQVVLAGTTQSFMLGNISNHDDIVNLTSGLHFELTRHMVARTAVSVPLTGDGFDDPSLLVQFEVRN